jgi:hypothetical protein
MFGACRPGYLHTRHDPVVLRRYLASGLLRRPDRPAALMASNDRQETSTVPSSSVRDHVRVETILMS